MDNQLTGAEQASGVGMAEQGVKRPADDHDNGGAKKVKLDTDNLDGMDNIGKQLATILDSMQSMKTGLEGKIDGLEDRLTHKIESVVKEEVDRVKKEMQDQIDTLTKELENVKCKVDNNTMKEDISLNAVVVGLQETHGKTS